ncbi:PBPe domain-containing protein [Caerostris darwini]|uniref:PBPe domain-containing protein n=1 Tax=Caerostris darwini TaxID=1538125 RepID=A0AAV4UNM0_9ARAC|nr:PBPe domain-containing protein [Caerostris darwini]
MTPPLKIAILPQSGYLEINRTADGELLVSGFHGRFLVLFLTTLGRKYEFVVPKIQMFGQRTDGENWTGLIGMVNRSEADMAFSSIVITEDRYQAVDFSTAITIEGMTFMIEKPKALSTALAFLYPFDIWIWLCLVCFLVFTPIVFQRGKRSYWRILFDLFTCILRQPCNVENERKMLKLLFVFWWPVAMVLSFSYSAALLSLLTIPLQGESVRDFRELSAAVERGTHQVYAVRETDVITFLVRSKQAHYLSLAAAIERNNWFYSISNLGEGNHHISQHSVKLISRTSASLRYGSGEFLENMLISDDTLALWPVAAAFRRGFCCRARADCIILRMLSSGIPNKFLSDESFKLHLTDQRRGRDSNSGNQERQLSVQDISGGMMLWLGGTLLSLVIFLWEIGYHRFLKKKQNSG